MLESGFHQLKYPERDLQGREESMPPFFFRREVGTRKASYRVSLRPGVGVISSIAIGPNYRR